MNSILNKEEKDAFNEVINIAVGKAASTLSLMINRKITIDVSLLQLLRRDDFNRFFEKYDHFDVIGVTMNFKGDFTGATTLFFELLQSKTLVDKLLSDSENDGWDDGLGDSPNDMFDQDSDGFFTDSNKEAIIEVGNIMINAFMGSVGNLLNTQFDYALPELKMNMNIKKHFQRTLSYTREEFSALVLETVFKDEEQQIEGFLVMVFNFDHFIRPFLKALKILSQDLEQDEF